MIRLNYINNVLRQTSFTVRNVCFFIVFGIQEQVKAAAAAQAASEGEADGELSPLPLPGGQPPRRRGAISAEPVTEEDATSYVKKVTK